MIPNGAIQVSRAKVSLDPGNDWKNDGPPREEDSSFLYVVRDQFKDFNVLQLYLQETSSGADRLNRNSSKSLNQCSDWMQVI
jgi:hypothetical protein